MWATALPTLIMIYVVFNINGDIIGVANSQEKAVSIHQERYGWSDYTEFDTYEGGRYTDEFHYLLAIDRIQEYDLNKFYYQ